MRKLGLMVAFAACVAGVWPDRAKAGPDPPKGKYSIGIRLNDGSDPNVANGAPLIYPSFENGDWGVRVHGFVNLPAPNPGGESWWAVACLYIYESPTNTWPTASVSTSFTSTWTGAGQAYWTMFVPSGWGFPPDWNLPTGNYELEFRLGVNSPGTGGWLPTLSTMGWVEK